MLGSGSSTRRLTWSLDDLIDVCGGLRVQEATILIEVRVGCSGEFLGGHCLSFVGQLSADLDGQPIDNVLLYYVID